MQQNKSILFLSPLYYPHIGGVETHVKKISESLIAKGYDITILTEQYDKKLPVEEIDKKIRILRIPIGKSTFLKKFYIWKWMLFHLPLLYKFEIVHIHDVFYWVLPFRLLFDRKKVFITFHGYEGYPIKKRWVIMRQIAEKLTSGNICVGDFMKKWYKTVPSAVIYGGVSLPRETKLVEKQNAVFFGRLDDQTGIMEYAAAFEKIRQKYPKFEMLVVGEGSLRINLPKGIEVKKFTINPAQYINNHRFIFVSRYLSMLEALSYKKEVIAVYDNPVKKDYLLLSPFKKFVSIAKNSDEIALFVIEAIEKSNNKPFLNTSGYNWARTQTWDNVIGVYEKLWNTK